MVESEIIRDFLSSKVSVINGTFRVSYTDHDGGQKINNSVSPTEFLIPLIKNTHDFWHFENEASPENLGSLVELLRTCSFVPVRDKSSFMIVPDKGLTKKLGAFDTPAPIVKFLVKSALDDASSDAPPRILDPSCGAGYFLIEAIDKLVARYPDSNPTDLFTSCCFGYDIDPIAVELTKRNIIWHLKNRYWIKVTPDSISENILLVDTLDDFENIPHERKSFDAVIGNPPYQFLSGKGSPLAALKKDGKKRDYRILKHELDTLTSRFPNSSSGCKDRYKWFIDRSVELLKPGGVLCFITPNTWVAYPRYRDIRKLLSENGSIRLIVDLGMHPFKRAHVPTAILVWRASVSEAYFSYRKLTSSEWQEIAAGKRAGLGEFLSNTEKYTCAGDYELQRATSTVRSREKSRFISTLGDIAVIREGSHFIKAIDLSCTRKKTTEKSFPVIIDKTMTSLGPPEIGFIEPPERIPPPEIHTGERFFIRKTGDRLVIAPAPSEQYAVAHQNTYVGKVIDNGLPFHGLVGVLASDLMTEIYRNGPGGQYKRPHAQLRIHFLKNLPIVAPDSGTDSTEPIGDAEITELMEKAHGGSLETGQTEAVSRKIDLTYKAIEKVTLAIIKSGKYGDREILNKLVHYLYDLAGYHEETT